MGLGRCFLHHGGQFGETPADQLRNLATLNWQQESNTAIFTEQATPQQEKLSFPQVLSPTFLLMQQTMSETCAATQRPRPVHQLRLRALSQAQMLVTFFNRPILGRPVERLEEGCQLSSVVYFSRGTLRTKKLVKGHRWGT